MATMMDKKCEEYKGEKKVFECIENNLHNDVICYYNREIQGLQFDFLLLIKNVGLLVIEVKGWTANSVKKVHNVDSIEIEGYESFQGSPKKQARAYRFNICNTLNSKLHINPCVLDMVCYPFISEKEYNLCGLNIVSEPTFTLFKEDIEDKNKLSKKIINVFQTFPGKSFEKLNNANTKLIRGLFENDIDIEAEHTTNYSKLSVFPNELSIVEIDNLITEYFNGTKQILFVNNNEILVKIQKNIKEKFKAKNISYKNGVFSMNSKDESDVLISNNKLSSFIFEAYCVNELEKITNRKITIVNGQIKIEDKEIIEALSNKTSFNIEQFYVEHSSTTKNIQVRAGAGTGKTYSMISRISFLCNPTSKSNVLNPSEEIAMMTFTIDAATNMKTRLKTQFMNYYVLTQNKFYLDLVMNIEQMRISTIHSFTKEILSKTTLPLGVGTDFATVSGNYSRKKILKQVLGEYLSKKSKEDSSVFFNLPVDVYKIEDLILQFIDKSYGKGCNLDDVSLDVFGNTENNIKFINEIISDVIFETERIYSKELKKNNSLDLAKYMIYLNKCISDSSFNKNNYQFKYVFIDEFQDVDDSQIQAFLEMQHKLSFYFFIVGDLKQSIYRFRGATMDAFTKMGCEDLEKWTTFSLKTNYRTDYRLLEEFDLIFQRMGTNKYIPYNEYDCLKGIKENELLKTELLMKVPFEKEDYQTGLLYDKIFDVASNRKVELESKMKTKKMSIAEKTIAILVRTNSDIKTILNAAKQRGILIESDSNGNLYKLQSSIDLCKLTSALCNPYSNVYLFDLIMSNNINIDFNPNSIVGKTEKEKSEILISCLDVYYKKVLNQSWVELICDIQSKPVLKVLRKIYESSQPWKKYSKNLTWQTHYKMNYELLFENLSILNKKNYLTLNSINESLIIAISTGMEEKSREIIDDSDYVKIVCTTIHKSKGLEYDTVILPFTAEELDGLKRNALELTYIDGKLGYYIDLNGKAILNNYFITENEKNEMTMEESRILYVALTRAINKFVWFKENNLGDKTCWSNMLEEVKLYD